LAVDSASPAGVFCRRAINDPSRLPQFHIVGFTGHRQRDQPREIQGAVHAVLETLLPEAGQVRVIGENGLRDDNYLDCGMETVNGCDVFIALSDGQPARGKGGTADVVAYARELKKPLVIINAVTFASCRENFERFAPHDHNLACFNALPDAPAAPGTVAGEAAAPSLRLILTFQRKVDHAASRGAPQYRRLTASIVVPHVLATLIAAAALAFEWHLATVPWFKLFCLVGALGVALRYAGTYHHWVHCRLAAEITCSALATWGLPRAAPLFEDLDLAEFRQLTRRLHILHRRAAYALRLGELPQGTEELLYCFLPISLPVVAAALISFISVYDLQRRVARYRAMEHLLEASRRQIAFSQT
jgi:hypothetical protein